MAVAILLFLAGASWWWMLPKTKPPVAPAVAVPAPAVMMPSGPAKALTAPNGIVPPPRTTDKEELHHWWLEMSKLDKNFEWKMPINFYGKVVDEEGVPVEGADISFQWTNYSTTGSAEYRTQSDAQGLFQLSGVTGKRLGVSVRKKGYQHYYVGNRFSFEYAAYFEPEWYVPDASHPVIFKMHKNREADPLVVRENQEAELTPGQKKSFPIGPSGTAIVIERLPNVTQGPRGWVARVSVPGGGLAVATEEFPFEAPESGYTSSLEISAQTPKPPVWQGDNGAAFFVKTPQGYGRITVRNTLGTAWVYVTSYFNPKPSSRNLEFDPDKVIKFQP